MTYDEIQQKVAKGCNTEAEWVSLQREVLEEIETLTPEEQEEMLESGITEMLSMICSAFEVDT